ncbi:MAG: PIN domain-containing protein [Phycicoccus sp.]|nr:PIN domain-containing protein [Phycicoccus sp.]
MAFPVFLDTCVLYPLTLCDLLLRIAETGAYRVHWSPDVLEELQRNLTLVARHGERGAAGRIRAMEEAFPDASVTGYEGLMGGLACHPKDRHVVAAAVHSGCQLIVTANLKDFPPTALARHDLQAVSPDSFLLDQLDLYPGQVMTALRQQSSDSGRPRLTPLGLLTSLERCGVPKFVTEIRRKSELSTWAPRTV